MGIFANLLGAVAALVITPRLDEGQPIEPALPTESALARIYTLPDDIMKDILDIFIQPFLLPTESDTREARAAVDTLLAVSLVSKYWAKLATPYIEKYYIVRLPLSHRQITSRITRRLASSIVNRIVNPERVVLPARGPQATMLLMTSLAGSSAALAGFDGVKKLYMHGDFSLKEALESPAFNELEHLTLWCGTGIETGEQTLQTSFALRSVSIDTSCPEWLNRELLSSSAKTLEEITINTSLSSPSDYLTFTFVADFPNVRKLTIRTNKSAYDLGGEASLSSYPSLESLSFLPYPTENPTSWTLTQKLFDVTLDTLRTSARLEHLSLPIGKFSNLDPLVPFLAHKSLENLIELRLPNILRGNLDAKGAARALLAACESQGIRIVFKEEFNSGVGRG
ncbi:hypothetical protein RQP46_003651 [Phenoliferia psychrophenolica]